MHGVGIARDNRGGGRFHNACAQNISAAARHAIENLDDLRVGFSRAVDDLGHAGAERAMVVDLGEADILVGKFGETRGALLGRQPAVADLGKELEQGRRAHAAPVAMPVFIEPVR
jgi:hypothetical protein